MKRQGNIVLVEALEQLIISNGRHTLVRDTGSDGEYRTLGAEDKSAFFSRRYRVRCRKFDLFRGYFDILFKFDQRVKLGKVIIKDEAVPALINLAPGIKGVLYSIPRKLSSVRRQQWELREQSRGE